MSEGTYLNEQEGSATSRRTLMAAGIGKPAITHFEVLTEAAEHTMLGPALSIGVSVGISAVSSFADRSLLRIRALPCRFGGSMMH
jgi:hypothetical protein